MSTNSENSSASVSKSTEQLRVKCPIPDRVAGVSQSTVGNWLSSLLSAANSISLPSSDERDRLLVDVVAYTSEMFIKVTESGSGDLHRGSHAWVDLWGLSSACQALQQELQTVWPSGAPIERKQAFADGLVELQGTCVSLLVNAQLAGPFGIASSDQGVSAKKGTTVGQSWGAMYSDFFASKASGA